MVSVSLFASATGLPTRSAASVGWKPTVPLVATTRRSTSGSQANVDEAVGAVRGRQVIPARTELSDLTFEQIGRPRRRQRDDLKLLGMPAHDVQRLLTDRARASQQGDSLHAPTACR